MTKSLEWNLRYCLMVYLFDRRGQVRKEFVKEKRRGDLVDGLKRRFVFMGCLNLLFSPFIVVYLLIYSFFRYFEVRPFLTLSPFHLSHPHPGGIPLLRPGGPSILPPCHLHLLHHDGLSACALLGGLSTLLTARNTTKTLHP